MALEVLHNQANTHENEQFRRVVRIMDSVFDRLGYSGLLIGNPSNNLYSRFRADAILLYDHGAVIIDFKDYSGELILPHGDQEFKDSKWYAESASDRKAIEVKAGAHFLNPFRQLASYRSAFREIIENNPVLKHRINPSRICIANIFSGPLTITNKVPGCYPYYKIVQESSIGQFLYDQNNDNAYDEEIADTIKKIFPAKEYIRDFTYATETICLQDITVEDNAKDAIESFMKAESGDILVLASMEPSERDNLSKYIYSIADDYDIPEVYSLCHSARICRRLRQRGVSAYSLYSFIYGGAGNMETIEDEDNDIESGMQVVPLKADGDLDDRALFIIHEAHLVNRSLAQSDLLRFGSGRLLEDVLKFFNPDSRRKIVFIGDPYMLTFGSYEDSAMNMQCLKSLCGNRSVHYYCQPLKDTGANMKDKLRRSLASSIDAGLFNSLTYDYSDGSLAGADHDGIISLLRKWYGKPFSDEPDKAVLFYRKADCHKTNLWIKKDCLHNGRHIAPGDLLVAGNNIFIPDDTGFGNPERVLNGLYFTVLEIKDHYSYTTTPKGAEGQVTLSFTKARVSCLSLAEQSADIWILDNYLQSEDDLSKDEQIAMRIFINSRVSEAKARFPFRDSSFYERMKSDESYGQLDDKDRSRSRFPSAGSEKEGYCRLVPVRVEIRSRGTCQQRKESPPLSLMRTPTPYSRITAGRNSQKGILCGSVNTVKKSVTGSGSSQWKFQNARKMRPYLISGAG